MNKKIPIKSCSSMTMYLTVQKRLLQWSILPQSTSMVQSVFFPVPGKPALLLENIRPQGAANWRLVCYLLLEGFLLTKAGVNRAFQLWTWELCTGLLPSVLFSFEQVSRGIIFTEGNFNNKRYTGLKPWAFKMCTCDPLKMNCVFRTCEPCEHIITICVI